MSPRKFKYVIVNNLYPRICSEADTHKDITGFFKATSAGFAELVVSSNVGPDGEGVSFDVQCYGESISLNLKSKGKEDADILRRLFCEPEY